jgi:hypothetical protein
MKANAEQVEAATRQTYLNIEIAQRDIKNKERAVSIQDWKNRWEVYYEGVKTEFEGARTDAQIFQILTNALIGYGQLDVQRGNLAQRIAEFQVHRIPFQYFMAAMRGLKLQPKDLERMLSEWDPPQMSDLGEWVQKQIQSAKEGMWEGAKNAIPTLQFWELLIKQIQKLSK